MAAAGHEGRPAGASTGRRCRATSGNTLILGAHPGYIGWEEHEANLTRLHENAQANGGERRKSPPREGPALLQGLVLCGRCGDRMGVRYHMDHGVPMPEYHCQKQSIEHARPLCQQILGRDLDRAIGDLLVETVSPLALEVALAVQDELVARDAEADRLRHTQVERARYEADLAQRRYLRVDPDNRLVADSLEADWNAKLRALAVAQEEYERQRAADGRVLDEAQRAAVLALATDLPRLWADPATPQREHKRMVRLLLEDVTLLRGDAIVAHVRFRGGATRTLTLPLPLGAPDLRRTDPAVVAEIDRLLDEHTDAETAAILDAQGLRPSLADRFNASIVVHLRRKHGLADHRARLRRQGLLTLDEVSRVLGADPSTVKGWASEGRIPSRVVNDKGERLFERPTVLHHACGWCGDPIPATPSLRRGKKWCGWRCGQAAYKSRKLAARLSTGGAGDGSMINRAHEVQSGA